MPLPIRLAVKVSVVEPGHDDRRREGRRAAAAVVLVEHGHLGVYEPAAP